MTVPPSLRLVAWLQLLRGLLAAASILFALLEGRIHADFGILGIPIFFGLRNLHRGWRTCALVFLWLDMVVAAVFFVLGFATRATATAWLSGWALGPISPRGLCVLAILCFALACWQYRVLTRRPIRSLFLGRAKRWRTGTRGATR